MKILVTGSAGFIGSHLSLALKKAGHEVFGIDNLNDYYDVKLKNERKIFFLDSNDIEFKKIDLIEKDKLSKYLKKIEPEVIIHLAAQAGVRYSKRNPQAYIKSNIEGFFNILDLAREEKVKNFVFASSSSVYGDSNKVPFNEKLLLNNPLSIYAATKLTNEIIAKSYFNTFGYPSTGLRFFSVYGPWGRPDMAYYSFAEKILNEEEIILYENGNLLRDFTYIDDISISIQKLIDSDLLTKSKCNIYNIGNSNPIKIIDLLQNLEKLLNKKANLLYSGKEPGEVRQTFSDSTKLLKDISFKPNTSLEDGLKEFIKWFKRYRKHYGS